MRSTPSTALFLLAAQLLQFTGTSASANSPPPAPHSSSVVSDSPPPPSSSSSPASISSSIISSFANSVATLPESTCQFRTANYITHGLPQQCLRKSWATPVPDTASQGPAAGTTAIPSEGYQAGPETDASSLVPTSATAHGSAPAETGSGSADKASSDGTATGAVPPPEDTESPLDNAKFLSFEEWKEQNLAKAGQSAENFGQRAAREPRKRPGSVNGDLDSLGEDAEIEVDLFGADGNDGSEESAVANNIVRGERPSESVSPHGHARSKDAGKTCKERFNFASFDCAATVHKTNKECKGATSVLVENKDSYMLNKCNAKNKFVIVELCDDILVDTVVLANYEFFSSMFRTFRVSVSDKYPVKAAGWKELGLYEAKNSREIQAFLIENPLIWARYIKIEFLSHYGNEFYCPLSLIRVHGTTMMEEFRYQEELARGEIDESEEMEPEAVAPEIASAMPEEGGRASSSAIAELASPTKSWVYVGSESGSYVTTAIPAPSVSVCDVLDTPQLFSSKMVYEIVCPAIHTPISSPSSTVEKPQTRCSTIERSEAASKAAPYESKITSTQSAVASPSDIKSEGTKGNGSVSKSQQQPVRSASGGSQHNASKGTHTRSSSTTDHKSHPSSAASAPPAVPTTQESFYKTIHKRLQLLEANATLSLQYIEEQSRLFRDAFSKMEKRQMSKTSAFMEQLNATVLTQLIGFRQQYDQLWQSTVIALESQKESSEREIVAISQRLSILADEVIYQKRMSIIQSVLLLVTIILIIFSKTNHFDTPILQTMLSSRSFPRLPLESPPTSPPPPLIRKYMQASHSRNSSDGYDVDAMEHSGIVESRNRYQYSPPSSPPDYLTVQDANGQPQITRSSPATPSGRGTRKVAWTAEFGSPLNSEDGEKNMHHHRNAGTHANWKEQEEDEEQEEQQAAQDSGLMTPISDNVSGLRRTASDITPTLVYPDPGDDNDDNEEFLDPY